MKVSCDSCQAEYNIDESRIPPEGLQIKCPKCLATFTVAHPSTQKATAGDMFDLNAIDLGGDGDQESLELDIPIDEAPPAASPSGAAPQAPSGSSLPPLGGSSLPPIGDIQPSTPPPAEQQPSAGVAGKLFDFLEKDIGEDQKRQGPVRFRIRRKSGKVFGPFDAETVKKMLREHQLIGNEEAAAEGGEFKPLGAFEEFAETIRSLMEEPAVAEISAPPPPAATDSRPIIGPGTDVVAPEGVEFAEPPPVKEKKGGGPGVMLALAGVILVLIVGVALGFTRFGFFGMNLFKGSGGKTEGGSVPAVSAQRQPSDLLALYYEDTYAALTEVVKKFGKLRERDDDTLRDQMLAVLSVAALLRNYGANDYYLNLGKQLLAEMKDDEPDAREVLLADAAMSILTNPGRASKLLGQIVDKPDCKDKEALFLAGWAQAYQKKWAEAAKYLDRAVVLDPDYAKAYHALGEIQSLQGDFENAASFYAKAAEKNPRHVQSLVQLAWILIDTKNDLETAEEKLKEVFGKHFNRLAPSEQAKAYSLQARIHARRHRHEEVVKNLQAAIKLVPEKATYLAELGQYFLDIGQYEKAQKMFRDALAKDPKDVKARFGMAQAMWKNGDIVKAKRKAEELAKENPKDPFPPYLLGRIHEDLRQPDKALRYYQQAIKLSPKLMQARVALAKLHLKQGNSAEALGVLGEAVKKEPNSAIVHCGLGDVYLAQGNLMLAEKEYRKSIELDPEMPQAFFSLANTLREQKKYEEALKLYAKVEELAPAFPDLKLEKGYTLYLAGKPDEAMKVFQDAISTNPKDDRLYYRAGLAAVALKDDKTAVQFFQTATGLNGNNAEAVFQLGLVFFNRKENDKAMELFKRVVELDEKHAAAHYYIGRCYQQQEMVMDALEEYRTAIKLEPKFIDARLALGRLQAERLQFDEAIEQFKWIAKEDPKRVDVLLALGEAHLKQGEPKKALRVLKRAFRKDPKFPRVHYLMGRAWHELENDRQAEKHLKMAVKLDPKDPMPHYYLGYVYKSTNRNRLAVREFRRYLRLRPDAPDADDIRDEIDYLLNE